MNIAIDIRCLMEEKLTGVGEYTLNLLKNILAADNRNEYYLFFNSRKNIEGSFPQFKQKNVHYCGFNWPNKLLNLSLKLLKYPKLDSWIKTKYHTPTIDLFFFPNISFLAVDCPYIITAHDLSFEFFPEFLSFKRKLWHRIINPKKIFAAAKHIIAVSNNTKTDLISSYKIDAKKISTIFSGLSKNYKKIDQTDDQLKQIKQKYSLPEKFILFLGTLEPRKNISGLIAAYKILQKTELKLPTLILVGKLGWKFKKNMDEISRQSNIRFINYIHEKEKRYFYNLASVFVYPSFYEGFGFPPLEALLCGCPVIASNNSSMLEICGDKALLIDPNNIQDLAEAIKQTLTTPTLFTSTGHKEQIQRDFDWHQTATKTIAILNQ